MEKPQGDLRSLTCGLEMSAKSLPSYLESQHGIYRSRVIDRDLVLDDRESITYAARQSPSGAWDCPVPECPGSMQTPWNLQRHFRDRHPLDLVNIPDEGVLPRCPRCDMQTYFANSPNHELSKLCRPICRRSCKCPCFGGVGVSSRHTVRPLSGWRFSSVSVASWRWTIMICMRSDIISKRLEGSGRGFRSFCVGRIFRPGFVGCCFYKSVIQSVILLYGSETWSLSDSSMSRLEGFHFLAGRYVSVSGRTHRRMTDVYEEVGLFPIRLCIEVRRQTVAAYIVNRPIFDRCLDEERPREAPVTTSFGGSNPLI
ncbi:hypothetical protein THAOC_00176 [Thalassiosira oceanica]|uniref:C2H2-type domain-containing protein n=1 Tax=Thalassiosira oceanica TaxID=159749 RepID=K0TJU3_THAOC|nr:hypothetical protein THAOC_00176 [Thalassiosira oceanica]|eukprot:EJK77955.1 hypothetical protein THAOC_00176 [Thalassiosira oceanica]